MSVFAFLGGRVRLGGFKQAPLHSSPFNKGFWSSGCGSSSAQKRCPLGCWNPCRAALRQSSVTLFHCLQCVTQCCLHCCQFVCCLCAVGMEMVWWIISCPLFSWLHVSPEDCFSYYRIQSLHWESWLRPDVNQKQLQLCKAFVEISLVWSSCSGQNCIP